MLRRPKFLHQTLNSILEVMSYKISFDAATDNGDGTFTLTKICDFHHAQPGAPITIDGKDYTIIDYDVTMKTLTIKGTDAINVMSFDLYRPFFFHGTPVQTQAELTKKELDEKTPNIYLMEPYETIENYDTDSTIGRTCEFTLSFLTQADLDNWTTDVFYHMALTPMANLMHDFIQALRSYNGFNTIKLIAKPMFHAKYGVNIQDFGTNKVFFAETWSGVSVKLRLEIYREDECCSD